MLKLTVDSLDAVDEPLRGLYEEADGKFRLKVDGVEDTAGLKKALDAERKAARDNAAKVRKWEALGKSEDEIAALLAGIEEAERKKAEAEGDHQKIFKQHQDRWAKEKADLESELKAARTSERRAIIETSVTASLTKSGVTEEGLDLLRERLASRINFETVNGQRVIKIMQADGETPMAGGGNDGLATIDDLVKEAAAKWPSLFKASGATGSGKTSGSPGAVPQTAALARLGPVDRINALRGVQPR